MHAGAGDLFLKRISLGQFPCREFPAWGPCEGATVLVTLKSWVIPSSPPFGALPASVDAWMRLTNTVFSLYLKGSMDFSEFARVSECVWGGIIELKASNAF